MSPEQIVSVRNYLAKRFGTDGISIKPRKVADSVEVYLCLLYTSPSPRDS